MKKYRVEFSFKNERRYFYAESLNEVREGFWLNAKLQHTKKSDCVFWIPPHHIEYIQKTS